MEWLVASAAGTMRRLFPQSQASRDTKARGTIEPSRFLPGEVIIVEGEIVRVDYVGWGKSRRGRYVIDTADAPIIYEGPTILMGRLAVVRFTAIVRSHEYTDGGQLATVVENARDIVAIQKPSESYRRPQDRS